MRKFMIAGLVATALLGGTGTVFAGPVFAGTGTAGTAHPVTATAGARSAEDALFRAVAASWPAGGAAGRIAASIERLAAARPQASGSVEATAVSRISCASPTACLTVGARETGSGSTVSVTPFAARLHAGTWKAVQVKAPKGSKFTS